MVKGGLRLAQGTIAVLPLPFVLAFDVAATSDKCDQLVASLNDLAIRAGAAAHDRIHFLEDRVSLMMVAAPVCIAVAAWFTRPRATVLCWAIASGCFFKQRTEWHRAAGAFVLVKPGGAATLATQCLESLISAKLFDFGYHH